MSKYKPGDLPRSHLLWGRSRTLEEWKELGYEPKEGQTSFGWYINKGCASWLGQQMTKIKQASR